MHINYLSGRTFQVCCTQWYTAMWFPVFLVGLSLCQRANGATSQDTSQYPIFPWVLSDYTSETLNLEDERVYRDFAWPIGAQREDVRNDAIEK